MAEFLKIHACGLLGSHKRGPASIVGQLGTGKFSPRTIWNQELEADNVAPIKTNGQFSTQTIWHPDTLAPENLAPGQFDTKHLI